jgi:hypothetical protein
MAIEKVIDIKIQDNFDKVIKNVDDLKKGMQNVQKETEDISKSAKNAEKGVKSIGDGFKAVGLSIKAMGIGLLLEAFAILKDVFSQNQVVADKFATALGAVSKVFNDLVSFLIKNIPDVIDFFKDIFENPQKHIEKLGTLIKENLIERFDSLLKTAGYLGEALSNLFEGKIAAAVESVKKAGKESVDIFTGVNNSVDKAGQAVEDIADAISKYGKETWNAAAANVELQKAAEIAAAEQAKLVEKYDRDAEKQRQIRDNDLLSIQDRIKANNELKGVLDLQAEAMNKLAAKQKEAAEATYNLNKSTANKIALINAEANELGVLAQIEGLRSEQKINEVSLSKELIEMKQSEIDATAQLALENEKFNATLEKNNLKRLSVEKEILLAEQETEKQRLQLKIDSAAIGTQARVDAELELKTRMQEIGNEIKQNAKDTSDEEIAIATATKDAKVALQNAQLDNVSAGIGVLKTVFEKNKDIQKGLLIAENAAGIAKIIINTQVGNAKTIAQMGVLPAAPLVLANNIGAGISIAASVAATVKGLQALGGGAASGGSVPSGGGGATPPSFNVVGNTGVNQLAGVIGNKEAAPVQAYVVANNVTTAQSLDRNIIASATLGG